MTKKSKPSPPIFEAKRPAVSFILYVLLWNCLQQLYNAGRETIQHGNVDGYCQAIKEDIKQINELTGELLKKGLLEGEVWDDMLHLDATKIDYEKPSGWMTALKISPTDKLLQIFGKDSPLSTLAGFQATEIKELCKTKGVTEEEDLQSLAKQIHDKFISLEAVLIRNGLTMPGILLIAFVVVKALHEKATSLKRSDDSEITEEMLQKISEAQFNMPWNKEEIIQKIWNAVNDFQIQHLQEIALAHKDCDILLNTMGQLTKQLFCYLLMTTAPLFAGEIIA